MWSLPVVGVVGACASAGPFGGFKMFLLVADAHGGSFGTLVLDINAATFGLNFW
jgi:hypothetical protein